MKILLSLFTALLLPSPAQAINSQYLVPSLLAQPFCSELSADWTPQYTNLKGYWKMNGKLGAQPAANTNGPQAIGPNGTYRNANGTGNTVVTGIVQQALTFDGVDDYITVAYNASLAPTTAITVATWVKFGDKAVTGGVNQPLVSKSNTGGYSLYLNTVPNLNFQLYFAGVYKRASFSTATLNNGQWYHVVGTYDGANIRLYIDGVNVGTTAQTGAIDYSSSNTLCIAREVGATTCSAAEFFNGVLDDVAIWDVALSAAEITTLYNRRNCVN